MKRLTLILFMIMIYSLPAHAFLGMEKMFKGIVNAEVSALRQDVRGDVNGVKADIAKLADIQMKMDAKLTNTMTGIAGVDNKITTTKTSVGRDYTSTVQTQTTNDTALMKAIISAMSSAIAGLMWYIRIQSKHRAIVEGQLMALLNKQEDGQERYVENLEKTNQKYQLLIETILKLHFGGNGNV